MAPLLSKLTELVLWDLILKCVFPHSDAGKIIDGRHMTAIPGLIDCHVAGHGLVRSLGAGGGNAWYNACAEIYARASTVDFWQSDARLAQLERLKAGATISLTLLDAGSGFCYV